MNLDLPASGPLREKEQIILAPRSRGSVQSRLVWAVRGAVCEVSVPRASLRGGDEKQVGNSHPRCLPPGYKVAQAGAEPSYLLVGTSHLSSLF